MCFLTLTGALGVTTERLRKRKKINENKRKIKRGIKRGIKREIKKDIMREIRRGIKSRS